MSDLFRIELTDPEITALESIVPQFSTKAAVEVAIQAAREIAAGKQEGDGAVFDLTYDTSLEIVVLLTEAYPGGPSTAPTAVSSLVEKFGRVAAETLAPGMGDLLFDLLVPASTK